MPALQTFCRNVCRCVGVPLPPGAREGAHLFPRALLAPGWRHLIDKLIRMGLGSVAFFLAWFELLKKVAKFLRQ